MVLWYECWLYLDELIKDLDGLLDWPLAEMGEISLN